MPGLCWTYQDLTQYLDQLPHPARETNPIIKELLVACPGSNIFAIGGHSVVLCISPGIAAKVALEPGDARIRRKQDIFALLDRSPCQHIVQCFVRAVDVTFLELVENGTLHDRMSFVNKSRPVLQWMLQLSSAAASVEALGYAHGDTNPQNILFDSNDQLRLIDFDHSSKAGEDLDVGYEPYVRQHREAFGGVFGTAGPVTEQFALGSVFWYMTRGSELYSELEGHHQVNRLLNGVFPSANPQDPIDVVIANCWSGHYTQVAGLVDDIRKLRKGPIQDEKGVHRSERQERERLCKDYYSRIESLSHKGS